MKITLSISGTAYDITPYVDLNSISYSDAIDETLGSGGFFIPYIKSNSIGYNMGLNIPRYSVVTIEDDQILYYLVSEDIKVLVRKGSSKLYSHKVTLIEPTKILQRRVIPNQTVTQPKGNLDNYIYIMNRLADTQKTTESVSLIGLKGVKVQNTAITLTYDYGISNDTSVINNNQMIPIRDYSIVVGVTVYNAQGYGFIGDTEVTQENARLDLQVDIDINSTVVKTETYSIPGSQYKSTGKYFQTRTVYIELPYTPSSTNSAINIKVKTLGTYLSPGQDTAYITSSSVRIVTYEESAPSQKIYLDQVVDKLLKSVKIGDPEYTLSNTTRARISNVEAPEFTWDGYTLYEALQECASYVAAMVYLGEDDITTVHFYFFDDDMLEDGIDYVEEEEHALSSDYITALEINAQNVIKEDSGRYKKIEPFKNGFMTARLNQNGGGQITEDTAAITLRQGIYRPLEVYAKGFAFTMYDETDTAVAFADTVVWDITNFVVEQTKWSSLLNQSSANSRSAILDKGNTLYYVQGQNRILNLGYNDLLIPPAWNTATPLNYAIVEAILCQAQVENPSYYFVNNYKPPMSIFDLSFQVHYVSYSNARVTVYRDDALAHQRESTMYFNEQAQINDMKSLGDIAKKYANRKGNEISFYKGYTQSLGGNIVLGMKNARGEKLTRFTVGVMPNLRTLSLEYAKNYTNISSYRGIPSAYRQWQVPNNNLVHRRDKYTEFYYLSETNQVTTSIFTLPLVMKNFLPTPSGEISTYATIELDYDGLGYTDVVEATVDTQVYGNTLVLSVDMDDNYSAGAKRIEGDIGLNTFRYQQDTRYTDNAGQVKNVRIKIYNTNNDLDTDYDSIYPDNATTPTTTLNSTLAYEVNKDAREILGISEQIVFGSDSIHIKTYSGMAKYNGLAMNSSEVVCKPFLLEKGYFPVTDDIDFTRLIQVDDYDATVIDNAHTTYITSPIGEYEGFIWVEFLSREPIYAVKTSLFDSTLGTVEYDYTVYGNIATSYIYPNAKVWILIDTTTPDYTITQTYDGYVCPTSATLPDTELYTLNDVIKIDIYRLCNNDTEICNIIDPEIPATVFCRSEYYRLGE